MPALRRLLLAALVVATALATCAPSAVASTGAGKANFVQAAESSFDAYTKSPSPTQKSWMGSHYWRMRTYAPYFNSRLSWFKNAWAYQDLYAIYSKSDVLSQHPDWVLKDGSGRRMYIPFACSNGSCSQFAGDPGNPAFRAWWIAQARDKMASGYRGLFVDDVNMEMRVGDGSGTERAPIDPRTGRAMTKSDWRRYVAEFTEMIRAAFPSKEIVHNAIWYSGYSDPYVQRELRAADLIELERGVNDGGITSGGGKFGYETFLSRVDWIHAQGKGVIFDGRPDGGAEREYGLASYFMTSSGGDGIGDFDGGKPDSWWRGYDTDLGAAQGGRYEWQGVLRRDFERGSVVVNQPGEPRRTVDFGSRMQGTDGAGRNRVTVAGGQGAVLTGSAASGRRARTRTALGARPNPRVRTSARSARRSAARRMRRAVLVRGKVRGGRGGRVSIRLERRVGRRWTRAPSARVRLARRGAFRRTFRGLKQGARYRVRASYLGSTQAAPSRSRARRFRLRH